MCFKPRFVPSLGFAVRCGKCFECRVERSREWSFRLALEAKQHSHCCMVTLTYNAANLPLNGSVSRETVQSFMKRLRKAISPVRVRFFAAGEYGEKRNRPHYHIILFGYDFPDRYFFKTDNKGTPLYRSPQLEKIWTYGFSSVVVGLTPEVCKYVAVYLQKPPSSNKHAPFVQMSNRPGIGYAAVRPEFMIDDRVYFEGKSIPIPRYFLKVLEQQGFSTGFVRDRRCANSYRRYLRELADYRTVFRLRDRRIEKIEKIFGVKLDRDKMV